MLSNNEIHLLFSLLQYDAINDNYAALISGYDEEYLGDLIEAIDQETGIALQGIDIEGVDAEGQPSSTYALLLPDSEQTKAADIIYSRIKSLLSKNISDKPHQELDSMNFASAPSSSLHGDLQVC